MTHEKKIERELYRKWHNMVGRCHNETWTSYAAYGGKGIEVSYYWRIWPNFWKDMVDSYTKHVSEYGFSDTSIDRIDNSRGYEPGNVRWATIHEQLENRFQNKAIMIENKKVRYENKYYRELLKGDPRIVKPSPSAK